MASTRQLDDDHADDRLSDTELIARLRSGDHHAYEALWSRHVAAALRLARRYDLQHAEDLVSESFLAVYDQIAVAGNGPETAFRAYLFTVIRNAAAKAARQGQQVVSDPEIDTVDGDDGLTILAREEDAADLLESFKALPERWQRVLWLAEVDQVPRGAIAQELGIRPNAVSALLRRARSGLQYHWLLQRVPSALQSDPTHVARFLPAYITGGKIEASKTSVLVHLQRCETCRHVHEELSLAHGRMRKTVLSVSGFAALSVTLPTSTPVPAAAAASLLAVFGAGTALSGVGVTAVVAGGALVATLVAGAPFGAQDDRTPGASDSAVTDDAAQRVAERPPGFAQRPPGVEETPMPIPPAPEGVEAVEAEERPTRPGRGDSSTPLPELDLEFDFDTLVTPPARPPAPQPVSVAPEPDPDSPGTENPPAISLSASPPPSSYLAPVFGGTADASVTDVYVSIGEATYLADSDAAGLWSFDARALPLAAGTHSYRIWAVDEDGATSAPLSGEFAVLDLTVQGFEDTADFLLAEASSSGIVFTTQGPAGGRLCIDADSGQSAVIPFDENGTVTRRIRFMAGGFYTIAFAVCQNDAWGVATEHSLFVDDPSIIFGPFDPEETWIEIDDPAG